ncbi:MAG: PAS domain-containing protein [Leptolyngbyaceae cyanobacterium bins.59]|nr:PAS domain-containing protein [Leptolyngbyaceae cyanobacterium bins.59]
MGGPRYFSENHDRVREPDAMAEVYEAADKVKGSIEENERFGWDRLTANLPGMLCQICFRADGSLHFPYVSTGCYALCAMDPEALQRDASLFLSRLHPDDRLALEHTLQNAVNPLTSWQWNGRLLTNSENLQWIRFIAHSEQKLEGDVYWNALLLDITAQKQAELERDRLFCLSLDLICIASFDGFLKKVNPMFEKILGYAPSELLSQPFLEFVHPDDREATIGAVSQLATGESLTTFENRYRCKDGTYRWLAWSSVPYPQEGLIYSTARDITDRKQAEQVLQQSEGELRTQKAQLEEALHDLQQAQAQLIQSEKMSSLGQLLAGVAHEINNPVNFIYGNLSHANEYAENLLGLVDLYQKHYPDPVPEIQEEAEDIDLEFLYEDLPKLLSSMKVGAERIQKIVASLRIFSHRDETEFRPVNIHEGLDSTLMILQNRLKAKSDHVGIEIVREYGNLPAIECYAGQLNQVFMNILVNAIDALEELMNKGHWTMGDRFTSATDSPLNTTPTITIRTGIQGDYAQIRIMDNGPGIPEPVQQRIFDPFFTTKPVGKGTGMGMSISYQIVVEKHRGRLRCESSPHEGATFIIEIPLRQS